MSRTSAIAVAALAILGFGASEARAQFGMPLGAGSFSVTAPEVGGAIGAGAATNLPGQQACTPEYRGRGGVDYQCAPDPARGSGKR